MLLTFDRERSKMAIPFETPTRVHVGIPRKTIAFSSIAFAARSASGADTVNGLNGEVAIAAISRMR